MALEVSRALALEVVGGPALGGGAFVHDLGQLLADVQGYGLGYGFQGGLHVGPRFHRSSVGVKSLAFHGEEEKVGREGRGAGDHRPLLVSRSLCGMGWKRLRA